MVNLPVVEESDLEPTTWWQQRAPWLMHAMSTGLLASYNDEQLLTAEHPLEPLHLGELSLTDGRLVVADPYMLGPEPAPILQQLQQGAYAVVAFQATVGPGHHRIAASALICGDGPIVTWDMARWASDQDLDELDWDGYYGYGVDAGVGCFADADSAKVLARVLTQDAGMLEDPVSRALFDTDPGVAFLSPEPGAGVVAAFSAGWGDGSYPTWLGLDGTGRVVLAVTDFLLTSDPFVRLRPNADPEDKAMGKRRFRSIFRR